MNKFLKYSEYEDMLNERKEFVEKISGGGDSVYGKVILDIFNGKSNYSKDILDFVKNSKNYKDLELSGDTGYVDIINDTKISKEKISAWFSSFSVDKGKVVGKGEVLLAMLYKNVYKMPIRKSSSWGNEESGDLYISNNEGDGRTGRIEVKSALPGGLEFSEFMKGNELEYFNDGGRMLNAWSSYNTHKLGFVMDKDLFIDMCAYCIARYMHRGYRHGEDYYLAIFDNEPSINGKGNIHGTKKEKIKYLIDDNGEEHKIEEGFEYSFENDYGDDDLPFVNSIPNTETIISDEPGDSINGNDDIDVNGVNGFLYIKRGDSIEDTMERVLDVIDRESSIYKENKSNKRNNFTFYVKNKKLCIAHRDNPPIAQKKK